MLFRSTVDRKKQVYRIDINGATANSRTLAHELAHAVLINGFGTNEELFNQLNELLQIILLSEPRFWREGRGVFSFDDDYIRDLRERFLRFRQDYDNLVDERNAYQMTAEEASEIIAEYRKAASEQDQVVYYWKCRRCGRKATAGSVTWTGSKNPPCVNPRCRGMTMDRIKDDEIKRSDGKATFIHCDVSKASEVKNLFASIRKLTPHLDYALDRKSTRLNSSHRT